MTNRPRGFYREYLEKLIRDRQARGEPEAELFDESYWSEWRANHEAASKHEELQDRKPKP
jgi:hypothetical protein